MKRILLILLVLTLLFLPACAEEPDMDTVETLHTSRVCTRRRAEYGDFLCYYAGELYCYNRKTGEIYPFCTDPNCNGNCILESSKMDYAQPVDGRLYICSSSTRPRERSLSYIDLVTGEVTVLLTSPKQGASILSWPVVDNGWVYYTDQRLREGGEAENPDDYEFCVFRIPMDGGISECVCEIEDNVTEQLFAVVDGKPITVYNYSLYSNDPTTGERKLLFDPQEHGYNGYINKINYLDGYFYCLFGTREYHESEYYPEKLGKEYLLKINARTGAAKQLLDVPVQGLIVTEDAIYYTEQMIRTVYVPEDYEKHPEKVVVTGSSETLYACDLDGGNRREVFTDPYLDLNYYSNCVIDNCMYGVIYKYDETAQKMVKRYGKLDFATGEFTPATPVE